MKQNDVQMAVIVVTVISVSSGCCDDGGPGDATQTKHDELSSMVRRSHSYTASQFQIPQMMHISRTKSIFADRYVLWTFWEW